MSEHTKKKLIAVLLFISCVISAWLLFITPNNDTRQLQNLAQADSLIRHTLADFNISGNQVSAYSTQIDRNFSRMTHVVSVPPRFSKTQLHATLQNRLAPYHISLPARVLFPDQDMQIQLDYQNTVIRTVRLVTDEDLTMQQSFASIIVAFASRPPDELLETLTSFGEPLGVAVMLYPPFDKPDWWDDVQARVSPHFIWAKTSGGDNLLAQDKSSAASGLESIQKSFSETPLLGFSSDERTQAFQQISFPYIDMSRAVIFNEEMDHSEFQQAFRTFVQQARSGRRPTAVIMGTEQTLNWTQNELHIFNKSGLSLIAPN